MEANRPVIICGTDFSVPATQAAAVAAAIARKAGARLLLMHAAEHPGMIVEPPEVGEAFIQAQSKELHDLAEELRALGTNVEEGFAFGPADKALVEAAGERQARMIVAAAVERARRLLTSSVAVRVAETASVPTLVVRRVGGLTSWLAGRRTLKILLGDDFSAAGEAALGFVADLTNLGPCEITIAHSYWPPEERCRRDLHGPVSPTESDPEIRSALEKKLAKRTHAIIGDRKFTLRVAPCWGRPDGYLLNVADRTRADLIVLGTHQRHGIERFRLGSVSRAVLNDALVSVAVVPLPTKPFRRVKQGVRSKVLAEA